MKYQILFIIFVSLVIFITRSASAGFLDELKEKLEGAVGEIEEPFDVKKNDTGKNQENKPAKSSSSSAQSGKDIASGSKFGFMCPLPQGPEKLPKDMAGLESDFGRSASELADIFKNNNQAEIPFILTLKQYGNAFDGREIKEVFNKFLNSRDPRYLALIREASLKKYSPITWVKKADAEFAYGLVHVYYQNVGGNAEKGYKLIKKAANGKKLKKGRDEFIHTQYGATYIEGTRQYNGYGEDIDLSKATTYLNKAYEVARNRDDTLAKSVQAEFLRLISEPDFPQKEMYAYLGKQADSMRQALEEEFRSQDRNPKSDILKNSHKLAVRRNDILAEIGTISGMGKDLEEFKVRAKQLASQANPSNSVVNETIILGDGFTKKLEKRIGSIQKLDEDGLLKLEASHQKNEILIRDTFGHAVNYFRVAVFNMSNGGGWLLNAEMRDTVVLLGKGKDAMCALRNSIIGFAERTEVTINSAQDLEIPEDI